MPTAPLLASILIFIGGALFSALVLWLCLSANPAQNSTHNLDPQQQFHNAFRQLALYLVLGISSFVLVAGVLAWRAGKSVALRAAVPATTPAPPTSTTVSSSSTVTVSTLTGVPVPLAQVVRENAITSTSAQQLQRLIEGIDARSKLGATEILMWRGAGKKGRAEKVIGGVRAALAKSGFAYRETSAQTQGKTGIREFVAVNRARKKIVPGFWMLTEGFLLLSWGEMETAKP